MAYHFLLLLPPTSSTWLSQVVLRNSYRCPIGKARNARLDEPRRFSFVVCSNHIHNYCWCRQCDIVAIWHHISHSSVVLRCLEGEYLYSLCSTKCRRFRLRETWSVEELRIRVFWELL
jgi:hypothetical protein